MVRSDPQAAEATLRYVRRADHLFPGYETDRAYRLLVAAMSNAPPEPVRPEDAELFRHERELGSMPLSQAFGQLRALAPGLEEIRRQPSNWQPLRSHLGSARRRHRQHDDPGWCPPLTRGARGPSLRSTRPAYPVFVRGEGGGELANSVSAVLTHTTDRALSQRRPKAETTGRIGQFGA